MPATFLYLLALVGWLCVAILVWFASVCLAILPITRRTAGPLASAMACTFPAVFVFQLAALPPAAAVLGISLLAIRLIDPSNSSTTDSPSVIGIGFALVVAEFLVFAGMSLLGFYEGWRVGWSLAKGRNLGSVIANGPTARVFKVFRRRR